MINNQSLRNDMKKTGFSAIEMMVVVVIIAILAMIAIPSSLNRIISEQIVASLPLADIAKEPVGLAWKTEKKLPIDNLAIGLPAPDKVVSTYVQSTTLDNGAIHMVFGNKAHPKIVGKTLTLRPAVILESEIVPIAWVCAQAKAPNNMTIMGQDKTDIPKEYLPLRCR